MTSSNDNLIDRVVALTMALWPSNSFSPDEREVSIRGQLGNGRRFFGYHDKDVIAAIQWHRESCPDNRSPHWGTIFGKLGESKVDREYEASKSQEDRIVADREAAKRFLSALSADDFERVKNQAIAKFTAMPTSNYVRYALSVLRSAQHSTSAPAEILLHKEALGTLDDWIKNVVDD